MKLLEFVDSLDSFQGISMRRYLIGYAAVAHDYEPYGGWKMELTHDPMYLQGRADAAGDEKIGWQAKIAELFDDDV